MIKSGTTEFNDMYWHFHGSARAVEEMGMRATLASVFIDFNDEKKAVEQRAETERLLAESESYSERITFSLGPHAIYTVSEASLRWIKDFSDKHDLPIHIHLSETKQEVEDCVKLHGLRPVEWLERIGFLGANVLAAHVIHVTDEEIEILARRRVRVVHCPVSNMKLVSGSFPYARMRAAGVEILLGTDGCASNNNLDLLEEMKVAALHAKLVHGDPTVLPAREAFLLATSAREIAEGARADCMLVDLKNHRLAPGFRLVDDLVYSADASCIDTVICAGQILMQGGQVKNETAIVSEAQGYKKRFQ
jgi:5-methylthioadenosine/S-adenosylhomocysteine deaminase